MTTPNPQPGTEPGKQDPEQKPAQPNEPAAPTPPAKPEEKPDYEKKFSESTRENQILSERIKVLEADKSRRESTKEPTDSELQAAFPEIDFELADPATKRLARESFLARKTSEFVLEKENEREADRRWNTDLEMAIAKNPSLQGKEQQFKEFANKPTHRGAPTDILVDAFLNRTKPTMDNPNPNPAPQPGLEPGNGGPREPEKPKLLTAEELATLRKTDEKAYTAYVKAHPDAIEI